MIEREEKIKKRIFAHYKRAIEHYGEDNVLGVFLYGSQNYDCDIEGSDVDTKCILLPDLYHLALHPYKTTHLSVPREEGEDEVCECMTIQHMVANWKKQNPNFLEIMFTPYCYVNAMYRAAWDSFIVDWREEIARYDVRAGVLSIAHQAIHTIKQNPMDGKKLGNGIRLWDLLSKYSAGKSYMECLKCDSAETVRKYKAGQATPCLTLGNFIIDALNAMVDNAEDLPGPRRELDVPLDNFVMMLLNARLLADEY
jgi:hypothetical protein